MPGKSLPGGVGSQDNAIMQKRGFVSAERIIPHEVQHIRDRRLTGHAVDLPKSTLLTLAGGRRTFSVEL